MVECPICGCSDWTRFVREVRNRVSGTTKKEIFYRCDKCGREMSEYAMLLEAQLNWRAPWEYHTYRPLFEESKVVSTEKIVCGRIEGEVHTGLLLIHEDGSITVKCSGDCSDCVYGDVE